MLQLSLSATTTTVPHKRYLFHHRKNSARFVSKYFKSKSMSLHSFLLLPILLLIVVVVVVVGGRGGVGLSGCLPSSSMVTSSTDSYERIGVDSNNGPKNNVNSGYFGYGFGFGYGVSAFTTVPTTITTTTGRTTGTSRPTKTATFFFGGYTTASTTTTTTTATTTTAGIGTTGAKKPPRLLPTEFRLGYIDEKKHDWKNSNIEPSPSSSSSTTESSSSSKNHLDVAAAAAAVPVQQPQRVTGPVAEETTTCIESSGIFKDGDDGGSTHMFLVDYPINEYDESNNFVYGANSRCYRGLTRPTKAGLVLASMLSFGIMGMTMMMGMSTAGSSSQSLLDVVDISSSIISPQQFVDMATTALSSVYMDHAQASTGTTVVDLSQWIHDTASNLLDLDLDLDLDLLPVKSSIGTAIGQNMDHSFQSLIEQTASFKERSMGYFADSEQLVRSSIGIVKDRFRTVTSDALSQGRTDVDQTISQWSNSALQLQSDAMNVVDDFEKTVKNQIIDLRESVDSQLDIWKASLVDNTGQIKERFDVVSNQAVGIITSKLDECKSISISSFDHGVEQVKAGITVFNEQAKDFSLKSSLWISDKYKDLEHSTSLHGDHLRRRIQDESTLAITKAEQLLLQAHDMTVKEIDSLKESSSKWTLETNEKLRRWTSIQIDQKSISVQNEYLLMSDWTQKAASETTDTLAKAIQNLNHLIDQELKHASEGFSTLFHQSQVLLEKGRRVASEEYSNLLVTIGDFLGTTIQNLSELSKQVESQSRELSANGEELALSKYKELVEIIKLMSDHVLTTIVSAASDFRESAKQQEFIVMEEYNDMLKSSQVEIDREIADLITAFNTLKNDVSSGEAEIVTTAIELFEKVRSEVQHQYGVQTNIFAEQLEIEKQALTILLSNLQYVVESQISASHIELLSIASRFTEALARILYEYSTSLASYAEGLASVAADSQTTGDASSVTGVSKESVLLKSILETIITN